MKHTFEFRTARNRIKVVTKDMVDFSAVIHRLGTPKSHTTPFIKINGDGEGRHPSAARGHPC